MKKKMITNVKLEVMSDDFTTGYNKREIERRDSYEAFRVDKYGDCMNPEVTCDDFHANPKIKWFSGIACKGQTADQSFLQKDLESIKFGNKTLADIIRKAPIGTFFKLRWHHCEEGSEYKIYTSFIKERDAGRQGFQETPVLLNFKRFSPDKVYPEHLF